MHNLDLFGADSGAEFSACGHYRLRLWRIWDASRPQAAFVMLNPSTADAHTNDATIERCIRRTLDWDFGGLQVANLFAWRSTDPKALARVPDPVGTGNDQSILEVARSAQRVICAWGRNGRLHQRDQHVLQLMRAQGITPLCLAINQDGSPKHPLYVSYDAQPSAFAVV